MKLTEEASEELLKVKHIEEFLSILDEHGLTKPNQKLVSFLKSLAGRRCASLFELSTWNSGHPNGNGWEKFQQLNLSLRGMRNFNSLQDELLSLMNKFEDQI